MISLSLLNELELSYREQGYSSQNDIDMLKKNGKLDFDINTSFIPELLKTEMSDFIDSLIDVSPYIIRKKIQLEDMYNRDLSYNAEYMLCHYIDNIYCYRDVPKELLGIIKKLDIDEFKYLSLGDLKSKFYRYLDVIDGLDSRGRYSICTFNRKCLPKKELYNSYDPLYDPHLVDAYDRNKFFVWSEQTAFNEEKIETESINIKDPVLWVSRYYGDGYGFDILSIDPITNREKLIEVKSGKEKEFSLTENETKVMRNSKYKNADYYVYRYYYTSNVNEKIKKFIYKYNPELDMMVDLDSNLYSINEYLGTNDEGKPVKLFSVISTGQKLENKDTKKLILRNTNN